MKRNILLFAILGLISGYLSLHAFGASEGHGEYAKILGYGPGWIFGGIISFLLYFLFRKNIYFHVVYIGISTFAFYVALFSLSLFDIHNLGFFMAGLIGSSILILGLRLVYPIPIKYMAVVIMVGGVAALPPGNLGIFPIWQTAVGIVIGYAVNATMEVYNKRH